MPLFVRSFHLTSHGLHCSHFTACTHHSTPLFGSEMEEKKNVPQPNWTTWWNHFCYTGIPWLSALHCLQQLQAGACSTPIAQPLFYKQESNDTTPPVPSPQPPLSCQLTLSSSPHQRCSYTDGATVPPKHHATTADASTQLSISETVQFYQTPRYTVPPRIMETSVKHKPSAIQITRCQPHSPMPPRSFLLLSSWSVAASPVLSRRVASPAPPSSTLLLDAATQTPPNSADSADATTQLPLTEFFLGCDCSKDPLDRSVPPPTHGNVSGASLPQPSDVATFFSLNSTSSTSGGHVRTPVPRARLHSAPPPPPGLEHHAPLSSPHGIPVKAAPVRPRSQLALAFTSSGASLTSTSAPSLQPQVSTTQVGTRAARSSATHKRSASAGGNPPCHRCRPTCRTRPFPKATACCPACGQFWASQTCWTWSHWQRGK